VTRREHPAATAILVAALTAAAAVGRSGAADEATARDAAARAPRAGRLEWAAGCDEEVVAERIDRERSTWRRAGAAPIDRATRDVVRWGECPPWPVGPTVLLADGGVIAGTIEAADAARVAIRSACLGRIDLPARLVTGFRRSQGTGPGPLGLRSRAASLLLANGDVVAGDAASWHDGVLMIGTVAGTVAIPAERIEAIDLAAPAPPAAPPAATRVAEPRLLVALADGSRLPLAELRPAADPDRFELAVAAGGRPPVVVPCDRVDVVAAAVDGGAARLLATLEPAMYSNEPILGPVWPLAVHRTLTGDWPTARGTTGFSSLGIHAPAAVRYRLERPAVRFTARVAIDDTAAGRGAVVVRVRARAAGGGWREVFVSGTVRGGDPPLACDVPLAADPAQTGKAGGDNAGADNAGADNAGADNAGADEIELVADTADEADVLARTIWLDPRVVAAP